MRPEISQETAEAVRKAADRAVQGVDTDELSFEQQVRAILRAQQRQTRAGSADLFQ
jgi:predicted secreted Zn-dependent protease